jgi:hypothetical protein
LIVDTSLTENRNIHAHPKSVTQAVSRSDTVFESSSRAAAATVGLAAELKLSHTQTPAKDWLSRAVLALTCLS